MGPTLWTLLNTVGLQTSALKNGILWQYVIATGSDGYTGVFSLDELAPQFGGSNPQDLVAYQQNGAPLGSAGFARIVEAKLLRAGDKTATATKQSLRTVGILSTQQCNREDLALCGDSIFAR